MAEIAFALIGVALLTFFGVAREERERPDLDCCSSYDARGGGYRAWYELLQREGMDVMRFERHWAFLDASIATFIIAAPPGADELAGSAGTPTGPPALAAWVKNGGRLLELLSPDQTGKRELFFPKRDPFGGLRYHALSHDGFRTKGMSAARMGRGQVIRVEDEEAFDNGHIGRGDTARTAYFLALSVRPGAVAFEETIHGHLVPEHWWQVAPRRLVFAIVGAGVVLAIALLGAAIRLGPPILPPERREATSAEYVDAVAALYAQAGAKRKVVQDVAHSLRRATIGNEIGEHGEAPDLRAALIELDAVAAAPTVSESAFIRAVATGYRLRKKLK